MNEITSLQTKVDEYQSNPELCADLTPDQCAILAELQTIYNTLSNQALSNVPSIYSTECYGVKTAMEQLTTKYTNIESAKLCEIYKELYAKAREEYRLNL